MFFHLIFASFISFSQVVPTVHRHQETWALDTGNARTQIAVSAFVLTKSHWRADLVQERIENMNRALKTCNAAVAYVHYYKLNIDQEKVEIDDFSKIKAPLGMTNIAGLTPRKTALQFFYFDDYVEAFTSAGSYPFAIDSGVKGVSETLHNTAWFPFYTPTRRKGITLPYSEEAHETGHILTQDGHDTTGVANIMADKASIRTNSFTKEQCENFLVPKISHPTKCDQLKGDLFDAFAYKYFHFGLQGYMPLSCVTNTKNLYQYLSKKNLLTGRSVYAVNMVNKDLKRSLSPLASRGNLENWANHSFLIVDGLVLDTDYTNQPLIVSASEYFKNMWGDSLKNYIIQLRHPKDIGGFTDLEVKASIKNQEFEIYDSESIMNILSKDQCK